MGSLAFFVSGMGDTCGGLNCNMVDIYNESSGLWTVNSLVSYSSQKLLSPAFFVLFFFGYLFSRFLVCITVSHCPQVRGRYEFAVVGLGDKLLVTGGKQNGTSTGSGHEPA